MEDMKNYTVKERKIFTLKLSNNFTINTMPLPSGGPIVAMIHNIFGGEYESLFMSLHSWELILYTGCQDEEDIFCSNTIFEIDIHSFIHSFMNKSIF